MAYTTNTPHAFVKAGVYYFSRRVPQDLKHYYSSSRVSYSLRTKSASVATSRAIRAAQKLDEYWYHLRLQECDLPGQHLLREVDSKPQSGGPVAQEVGEAVDLSEAVAIYLRLKGQNRPDTFKRAAERSCGYLIDICGNKSITTYSRKDANKFRDALVSKGLAGSSITRVFGTVRSIINFAASEIGIDLNNPFAKVYFDRKAGVTEREPIPKDAITDIQAACRDQDDELRWLVALVSDSGMRLAEAAGLALDDISVDADTPHVIVKEHPWRRLKTSGSTRTVPLVGASLWAAQRLKTQQAGQRFAFPKYNDGKTTNANSASAALNKWMKAYVPKGCTMHGFRHSMRDRLRAVECPADIVDQIGGWQTEGVGHGYGTGYPIEVLAKWMNAVTPCTTLAPS